MKRAEDLRAVEEMFHREIPLTRAMGLTVVASREGYLALQAPVALNHNHLQTAFGGSINAVATLAGYALLWCELHEESAHVVVRESSIRFLRPIRETITAVCSLPDALELETFKNILRRKGKARITLRIRVEENEMLAAELVGTFVAVKK